MTKEGFIYIDNDTRIQLYNKRAKEIFGIDQNTGTGHPSGTIRKGDIVIIGDNCLGKDDGDLRPEDLRKIGIINEGIRISDIIMGVGLFEEEGTVPVYKHYHFNDGAVQNFALDSNVSGVPISVRIDRKSITISFGTETFIMNYNDSIGHIVVVDKDTLKVKFYQAGGYTARGESIGNLFSGKHYRAKGQSADEFNVIGKDICFIHEEGETIKALCNIAKGDDCDYKDKFAVINGISTLCSIFPAVFEGERSGAVLRVEDISALETVIHERDEALSNVEEMKKIINDNVIDYEGFSNLSGESVAMHRIKKLAYRASQSNSTVLILGESGTGKTLLAETIHKAGNKRDRPFLHVNCGAIPETLLESELFGYEKGSFTGASSEGKIGLFERASGGTIFLDEIGDISLSAQVKLLKVLQNKTFFRIGGSKEITVDVRIIAATNKNLEEEIRQGKFREDLFYRLNVFPISMPALRDRKEDINYLSNRFVKQICDRLDCGAKFLSPEAQKCLLDYDWPGNIRELENVLERAANIADGSIIDVNHLPVKLTERNFSPEQWEWKSFKTYVEDAEKRAVTEALAYCDNDKKKAMKALKIGKTNFYKKMNQYSIK